jgi:hypothetical protein
VKTSDGSLYERPDPTIVEPGLQRPAIDALEQNSHRAPSVSAPWLEQLVWSDVKRFITIPGEVLRAVREQLRSEGGASDELEQRIEELEKRLASKVSERERYARLFSKGLLDEGDEDALDHLLDLKNQVANLHLMLEAAQAEQADSAAQHVIADTTEAYLMALRERADEMEEDTPEAFLKRQRLVRLLVERITLHKSEIGKTTVAITYRFGPPKSAEPALPEDYGELEQADEFVGIEQNSWPKEAENIVRRALSPPPSGTRKLGWA